MMVRGIAKLRIAPIADLGTEGQNASDSGPEIAWIVT